MQKSTLLPTPETTDFMPINGTDYIELYVGNSKQAAHYYKNCFWLSVFRLCRTTNWFKGPRKLCSCTRQNPINLNITLKKRY